MDAPSVRDARPVRVRREPAASSARVVRVAASGPAPPVPPVAAAPPERRENRAATRRALRLSVLYAAGVAAVYVALVLVARAGPTGGSAGTVGDLWAVGALAVVVTVAGAVVALGAAPRRVELGDTETVVVGRFGRRYRFPGRTRLRVTVLQRFPAGLLSPVALESVEIAGGTTRRSFLLQEHLLGEMPGPSGTAEPAPR